MVDPAAPHLGRFADITSQVSATRPRLSWRAAIAIFSSTLSRSAGNQTCRTSQMELASCAPSLPLWHGLPIRACRASGPRRNEKSCCAPRRRPSRSKSTSTPLSASPISGLTGRILVMLNPVRAAASRRPYNSMVMSGIATNNMRPCSAPFKYRPPRPVRSPPRGQK
jgi:hypothetical protein